MTRASRSQRIPTDLKRRVAAACRLESEFVDGHLDCHEGAPGERLKLGLWAIKKEAAPSAQTGPSPLLRGMPVTRPVVLDDSTVAILGAIFLLGENELDSNVWEGLDWGPGGDRRECWRKWRRVLWVFLEEGVQ